MAVESVLFAPALAQATEEIATGLVLPTGAEILGDVFVSQCVSGTITQYIGLAPQACPGDLNGDGRVDGGDLGMLVMH